ncbi:50S ribosomal protein L19e [Candidatus Woesearchaeota archaeon]|nr:50S ribosomal protein L19e [Candidatus Woesearchaeota archaeon]
MELKVQKRIAASLLKCSPSKIKMDVNRLDEMEESITKKDIMSLIKDGAIQKRRVNAKSRSRARRIHKQKIKGKRKGMGSRKGKAHASLSGKSRWILKIRAQRKLLADLRQSGGIDNKVYRGLYKKSGGGFFRSKRHIMIYAAENNLMRNEKK